MGFGDVGEEIHGRTGTSNMSQDEDEETGEVSKLRNKNMTWPQSAGSLEVCKRSQVWILQAAVTLLCGYAVGSLVSLSWIQAYIWPFTGHGTLASAL